MDREAWRAAVHGVEESQNNNKGPLSITNTAGKRWSRIQVCLQDSKAPAGLSKASLVSSLQPILVTISAAGSVGCFLTDPSSRYQLPVLQLNSVPTASAWSWHWTPQVKGCPHLRLRGQSQGQTPARLSLTHHPSPWVWSFAQCLTELRKALYSPDHQFFIKGCNLGTARGRRAQVKVRGRGSPHPFQAHQAQCLLCTLTWKRRGPLKGGFGFAFCFFFFHTGKTN